MPPRSRSSTLASISSTHSSSSREFVASNPEHLIGNAAASLSTSASAADAREGEDDHHGPKSYRSEYSLRTIKAGRSGHGAASDDDSDAAAGDSGITLNAFDGASSNGAGAAALGQGGRRAGPQFVIDLAPSPALEDDASPSLGGRPRASTFGGVELPPSPSPSSQPPSKPAPAPAALQQGDLLPRPALATRGRSTSVSSLNSLRSLDPDLHLGGASLRERRPVLFAGLQAGSILVVSVVGLYLLLKALLPPIDDEHKDAVKLPKSFDDLKRLNEVLQVYRERNNWRVMGCYVTVYLFLQAFSVPGSMYLSILGGALWGVAIALPLVCTCVATGALLCYLMSAALGPAVLLHSEVWQRRVDAWTERVNKHRANMISYLVILRIAPLPPHWVVNVVAPHLGIPIWTFWISTFLGIGGVSYIHTQIGTTLDQMTSSDDFHLISWKNGLGLGGIILAVSIPILLRRYFAADIAEAGADEPGGAEPTEPLLHPRTSLSLDADGYEAHGTPRELLDGTTRSSTDGSARVRRYSDHEEGVSVDAGGRPVLSSGGGSADKVSRVLGVRVAE
ncbi:hypothetical protein JCM10207_006238 [Rhodosporidiobolus poonsookiae]